MLGMENYELQGAHYEVQWFDIKGINFLVKTPKFTIGQCPSTWGLFPRILSQYSLFNG
jgi:hypothetical protein